MYSGYKDTYLDVLNSRSYKIGYTLIKPFRFYIKIYNVVRHNLGLFKNRNRFRKRIDNIYSIRRGQKNIKHVTVYIRSYIQPTSSTFIRLISPFANDILQEVAELRLLDGEKLKFPNNTDVVVVQRTAIAHMVDAVKLIEYVKTNKLELFVDTDDAFGELNEEHPQYETQKERVDSLNYIIENADEVWFSTDELKELYAVNRSKVIRNTLDDKVWPKLAKQKIIVPERDKPLRIVYMGTTTHNEDFNMLIPVFDHLYYDFADEFKLYVIGVSRELANKPWIELLKPDSAVYPDFTKWFSELEQFDIGLSPLVDNSFNRNKSDIKCLDYLANGIKPIVSEVKAYENSELNDHIVRVNNTEDDWYQVLKSEIKNKDSSRNSMPERARAGFSYINKYRSTEQSASTIRESIERVEKKKKRRFGLKR